MLNAAARLSRRLHAHAKRLWLRMQLHEARLCAQFTERDMQRAPAQLALLRSHILSLADQIDRLDDVITGARNG